MLVEFAAGDLGAGEREPVARHLEGCRYCAWELGAILLVIGRGAGEEEGAAAPSRFGRWLPGLPWSTRAAASAAAVLLAAALTAVAGLRVLLRPTFVTSSARPGQTVAEAAAATGLRFDEGGITGESVVLASLPFLLDSGSEGSVVAIDSRPERRLDLAAFDGNGGSLWVASRLWPNWAGILGREGVGMAPLGMKCVVTRRVGDRFEETVALTAATRDRAALLLVDPLSGRLRGAFFHAGDLLTDPEGRTERMGPLPAADGVRRNLVVAGQHWADGRPRPCLSVLDAGGRGLQHVLLPLVPDAFTPTLPARESVLLTRIEWNPGREEVLTLTSEGLVVRIPVRAGRLEPGEASVDFTDTLVDSYNRAHPEVEGAFPRMLEEAGGRDALLRGLREQVRASREGFPAGWRDE